MNNIELLDALENETNASIMKLTNNKIKEFTFQILRNIREYPNTYTSICSLSFWVLVTAIVNGMPAVPFVDILAKISQKSKALEKIAAWTKDPVPPSHTQPLRNPCPWTCVGKQA